MNPRMFALLAIPAALAIPGHVSANSFGADADCDGMSFTMPRGEAGTVVTVTVNGRTVASQTVANQFDPVNLTVPTPDRTQAHTWVVTVDSVYNADQRWSETVAACVAPTSSTTTTVAPTTTQPVSPTTSTVPPATTLPPTVVTTPRPTPTTTTVPFRLPDTGSSDMTLPTLFAGLCVATGATMLLARRGGAK